MIFGNKAKDTRHYIILGMMITMLHSISASAQTCREAAGTPDIEREDWDHIREAHCIGIDPATPSTKAQDICKSTEKSQFAPFFCELTALYGLADKAIGSTTCIIKNKTGDKLFLNYTNNDSYTGFDRNNSCEDVRSIGIIVNTKSKRIETMFPMKVD